MIFIPARWLKVMLFPLWPFALLYWHRHRADPGFTWAPFDVWASRAWWAVLAVVLIVGIIAGATK